MVVSWRGKVSRSLKALLWEGEGGSIVYLAFVTFRLFDEAQTTCII